MEYSCLKTLAAKNRTSINKIREKHKDGTGKWGIKYNTSKGQKRRYLVKYSNCKSRNVTDLKENTFTILAHTRSSIDARLMAKECELCGTTTANNYEIHHVKKLKDIKNKDDWAKMMITRKRKTLVVCTECHTKIHKEDKRKN